MLKHEENREMSKNCMIIGGEIAALRAAKDLAILGVPVTLVNPSKEFGETTKMFQRGILEFADNKNIVKSYQEELSSKSNVIVMNDAHITKVIRKETPFEVEVEQDGTTKNLVANTVIIASGFEIFNAEILEEYGYKSLQGVLTIFDLESAIHDKKLPINDKTNRVIFILCVGSRIQRAGANPQCSTYCCSYSINQALRIKKEFPEINVIILYMDIRTVADHEYLYNEARKLGVIFIRGRPSSIEYSENKLITFYEDTLAKSQDLLPADIVVLAVGGVPTPGSEDIANKFGIQLNANKFIKITEKPVFTSTAGIFTCGSACEGVKSIQQNLSEGGAAAMAAFQFLTELKEL